MACKTCALIPCVCASSSRAPALPPIYRRPDAPPHDPFLTKEEFGLDLFETIKLIGGLLALEEQMARLAPSETRRRDALRTRQNALRTDLRQKMMSLSPSEVASIISRYPTVGGL
jgi:hypothetical protein